MSDAIIGRIDEMGGRIDELEKSIGELMTQVFGGAGYFPILDNYGVRRVLRIKQHQVVQMGQNKQLHPNRYINNFIMPLAPMTGNNHTSQDAFLHT